MRKPIIAGNWKMNLLPDEAETLAEQVVRATADADCEVVICPPFVDLPTAAKAIQNSHVKLGAQNVHWEEKGAFTGEISAPMLKALGVEYAIVGHSERRMYFGETDEGVNRRVRAALQHGITPIICVGESLSQREQGQTADWVAGQVKGALQGLTDAEAASVVIAYEPIWAIGTGKTATAEEANATIGAIRQTIVELFGQETAQKTRIQYGGSMNPKNAAELMAMEEIDGGLIGGASLKAADFAGVVYYKGENK